MKHCLITYIGLGSIALAAPPANDNFVNRISLGSGTSASATGTTVEATLESDPFNPDNDENDLDGLGGSSVWWKWTAPGTATVSVDTAGSAIDTVLGVFADGPNLSDTFVVGFNDESGDPSATLGTSRVVFQATAGTEYHIAIHGAFNQQGTVTLHLQSGLTPPLRISSLSLSPGAVDVASASQAITAGLGVASDAPFASGNMALHMPNSKIIDVPIRASHFVSGTNTNGQYQLALNIPHAAPPGTWTIEIALTDTLGRTIVYGRGVSSLYEYDHVMPEGIPGLFSVVNLGVVDAAGPTLSSFSSAPLTANSISTATTLTFSFRITDDRSGFDSGELILLTPSDEALTTLPIGAAQRVSGTALDGQYSITFTLPAKMPGGVWSPTLFLHDALINPSSYGPTDALLGSGSRINVTGAPNSYWAWLYPLLSGAPNSLPTDDLDGDGIPNVLEFAFGMSAQVNDSKDSELRPGLDASGLPAFSVNGSTIAMTYVRRKASTNSGLTYLPQFSPSLLPGSWVTAAGGITENLVGSFERVTINDPSPGNRRFGQVRVVLAE